MTYPPAPLQQQNYSQYPSPYSVSALSTGQTPGEHGLYVQADPAPASNPNLTAGFPYAEEHASGPTGQSDIKARLRKACDSCSTRKVKCDEDGPPCKPCAALDIACTFDRVSRRRGPPNRHAEALKKRRLDPPGPSGQSTPTSPTHAAHTLASFAQQQVLSAESICPMPLLQLLVDDYFTYVHPLIPIPHEPSFREALQRREDLNNLTFLALLASMIGTLVASFPRKPRLHLKAQHKGNMFPNSMSLIERCHRITVEARGPGYLLKELSVYDAVISYLQGLTAANIFNFRQSNLYFGECLNISRSLGLHRQHNKHTPAGPLAPHIGVPPDASDAKIDYISEEMGRRLFWVMFVGVRTMQILGGSFGELFIPPSTPSEPYPPLPTEVDDDYIYPSHILPQPPGFISELVGFNANVRVFCSCNSLFAIELAFGVNEIFDWKKQNGVLDGCLRAVKSCFDEVPRELMLRSGSRTGEFGSSLYSQDQEYEHPEYPTTHSTTLHTGQESEESPSERRRLQCEIQKANIYASQLSTRSCIVEKYWNLRDACAARQSPNTSTVTSPDEAANGLGYGIQPSAVSDPTDQKMAMERENIVKELVAVLGMISQANMEPNGGSFINKVRHIASTLLDVPRIRKGQLALRAEDYLDAFLDVLMKLERVNLSSGPNGEMVLGSEEDEEAELRHWANIRAHQSRFATTDGVLSEV